MPNHVYNTLQINGDETRIDHLLDFIEGEKNPGEIIDFNQILPMPASLDNEAGSRQDLGISLVLTAKNPAASFTIDGIPVMGKKAFEALDEKMNKDASLFKKYDANLSTEEIREIISAKGAGNEIEILIDLGNKGIANKLTYGAVNWYDWCIANWGTKWNAYESNMESPNTIAFETAWSCVLHLMGKLSAMYPDLEFVYRWADEDIGYNTGSCVLKDGELLSSYIPDEFQEGLPLACEVWGSSPEEYGYAQDPETGEYKCVEDFDDDL